jgi:hypothetical protein
MTSAQTMPERRLEDAELVLALTELLRRPEHVHLMLVAKGERCIRIEPEPGWRSYGWVDMDADENVLDRMAQLDDQRWPELVCEDGAFLLTSGDGKAYEGTDVIELMTALGQLLENPAILNPAMLMRSIETAEGVGLELIYTDQTPDPASADD